MTPFYKFALYVLGPLYRLFIRMKVEGRENIPKDRNLILVSNHISGWDPFTIVVSGWFKVRPLCKKELMDMPVIGFLLRKLGCIRVDRTDGVRAYAQGVRHLKAGEDMLIFPEGTRSRSLELLPFKPGAVALALKTNTALLPLQVIAPKGVRPIFRRTIVRYGTPIEPSEVDFGPEDAKAHYEKGTQVLREACIALRGNEMPN